jgi:putative transposase
LCFELYGKGLTTRDIGDVMDKFYGNHYSKSTISDINVGFYSLMESWRNRPLEGFYPVIYIDAIHVKVRRDIVSSEAFYVLLAVKEDSTREVIGIYNSPTESASMWDDIFKELKSRGLSNTNLVVTDNLTGIDGSIHKAFPGTLVQKCVIHLMRNLSKKVRPSDRISFCEGLKEIFGTTASDDTKSKALIRINSFIQKWIKLYPHVKQLQESTHIDYHLTYYEFDYRVRPMIYTTNWIERLNKDFRRTLKIRNALPSIESALTLMSKVAMDKEEKHYSYGIYQLKQCPNLMRNKQNVAESP